MKQEDWVEILQVIKERLNGLGRGDLADIDHYKRMYEQKSKLPKYKDVPIEKYLVLEILGAMYTDLYAGSPNLLKASMENIRKIVKDEDFPKNVYVITSEYDETTKDQYKKIEGTEETKGALSDLRKIIKKLRGSDEREK